MRLLIVLSGIILEDGKWDLLVRLKYAQPLKLQQTWRMRAKMVILEIDNLEIIQILQNMSDILRFTVARDVKRWVQNQ